MKNTKTPKGTLKKVLKYIGRYKLLLPVSLLFALITVALTLYVPILIGDAIDLMAAREFDKILPLLLKAGALILATALSQWIMSAINNRITYHVAKDVRADAFTQIEKLPLSYLDTHSHGDILSRTVNDTEQFAEGLLLGFTQLFTGVMTILGTLVLLIVIEWKIAIAVVLLTPLSLVIAKFIASRTFNMFKAQSAAKGEQTAIINEMLGNQKLVKAFSYEDRATEKFDQANKKLEYCSLRAIYFSSLTNPSTRFINNLVYAAVALVGALTVISTAGTAVPFTVGRLSTLLSYSNQYTKPFNEISGVIAEFQNALASAARVFELIEAEPEMSDEENEAVGSLNGEIELRGVSFSYQPDKHLIENLNLSASRGQRIAIVGPTGCGKTTLINLLMRFYDVNDGDISVDGKSIYSLTRKSLRKNYGMVLQDTWLKSGTVRENIIIGKPDATEEEIVAAAKASHAHSFIKRLKDGYDTYIGEDGGSLSQGQRQLISITRVMLALPPMLILDEATSSIDTRTEMKIQNAFATMMEGRTSFIVAHRLSTVREADIILVMNNGSIVEQGSHSELLSRGGFYAKLYNSQFAH